MVQIALTPQEADTLRDILIRYLQDLRIERADTDDKEFRAFLRERETFMQDLIQRLGTTKIVVDESDYLYAAMP